MIISSLNFRGGGSSAKRRRVSHIINKGNADFFFIQETKLHSIFKSFTGSFWRNSNIDYSFLPSCGASGGILSLWNTNSIKVLCSFGGGGFLGVKAVWKEEVYYLVNIYSPCSLVEKRLLWGKLLSLKSKFTDREWVIGGDFNAIKNRRERNGSSALQPSCEWREFAEFIDLSNLIDILCKGKKYSWFSGDGRVRSRIDRFLVADKVVSKWGVVGQFVGDRDVSDHCPVWLVYDNSNWRPKPFKFNNEWFANKDFLSFVEKEWQSFSVEGRGDFVLKEKLRLIKERLRWWNLNVFGKIDLAVEEGVRNLNEGDEMVDEEDVVESTVDVDRRRRASKDFWMNLKIKENMLIQKSRLKWLNDRDANSKFFHRVMKARRSRNHIGPILTDRGFVDSVLEVKEEVLTHFEKKFSEVVRGRPILEGISLGV
ncbi:uncharacterized protein LOC131625893 [Vicia villosa]|uniref:uncharacterized protein LOC131625893 n=1 Tax=Vicia villosa TaxID=3911 RepID=UPI00273B056C|nr:uncharacterized protein LOC131625893 [Vicia villosa]